MLQSLVVEGEGWEVADGKVEFPDHSLMKTSEGFVFGEKGGQSTAISPDHRVLVEAERNSDWLVAGIVAASGLQTAVLLASQCGALRRYDGASNDV